MTESKPKNWFLRPRYSPLDLLICLVVIVGGVSLVARYVVTEYRRQLNDAAFQSPLPMVKVAENVSVPDDKAYQKRYVFSIDWFTSNIPIWEKVMAPYKGKPDIQYLEIGLFEGRSAIWVLENILTDPSARLTGIDIFEGPIKDRYLANMKLCGAGDKVKTIIAPSQTVLRTLPLESFDIIYIDGSHEKADVLEDAVLCYRLLKHGGTLIFDDYRYAGFVSGADPTDFPKTAIDPFAECFDKYLTVIHNGEQLILRKK